MKKIVLNIFLLFIIFIIPIYSQIPDWYTDISSSSKYKQYLTGAARAYSENEALKNAQNRLSETFNVLVESKYMSLYEEASLGINNEYAITNEYNYVEDIIETYSKNNLINLEVLESYYDERSTLYYALVGLHRENTANIIRNMILENEKEVSRSLTSRNNDEIYKYCRAMSVLEIAKKNDELYSQLYVLLGQNYTDDYVEYTRASDVLDKALNMKKQIKFYIASDLNHSLMTKIKASIENLGMSVVPNKEFNHDYIIYVNVRPKSILSKKNEDSRYFRDTCIFELEIFNTEGISVIQRIVFETNNISGETEQ